MTTLRELNEDFLPYSHQPRFGQGSYLRGRESRTHHHRPACQQRFVRINPQGVEWYHDRNPEPEGKERYPGIVRKSTLMFVHAELVDLHASTSVSEPIELKDDSGTCRWIPLTPSTVHWLSKNPSTSSRNTCSPRCSAFLRTHLKPSRPPHELPH